MVLEGVGRLYEMKLFVFKVKSDGIFKKLVGINYIVVVLFLIYIKVFVLNVVMFF